MNRVATKFKGLSIYKKKLNKDKRGYLLELFNKKEIKFNSVLNYISYSKKNTLRGLHFQKKFQQKKIVSVIKGEVLDVCVDLRKKSKTFGKYFYIKLNEKNSISLLISEGFAHGFCVLSNYAIMHYMCSEKRYKKYEKCINWNDKDLRINWPKNKFILSKRDSSGISFKDFKTKIRTL
jgi:dTDP-4-dehydrorhamnose 3,5-epimerase